MADASRTIQPTETKLPNLYQDQSIVNCLNQGIQVSARAKAAIIFGETDKRRHQKNVTKKLIGMPDYDSQTSEIPFKPKGALELQVEGFDVLSGSQKTETFINTSVFNVLDDNYSDYLKELEDQKNMVIKSNQKVRNTLLLSDRLKFDQDEVFARQAILNAKKQNEEDGVNDNQNEGVEPERNIEKLRARLKLKSIKKYTEDERHKVQAENKAALFAQLGDGDERLTSAQRNRRKHEPIKRRRSFTETQLKFEDGPDLYAIPSQDKSLSLTDKHTIKNMTNYSRYPIPEALMNKPKDFWLKVDSMIHNVYNMEQLLNNAQIPPTQKAPKNSDVSSDNLSIGSHSSEGKEKKQMTPAQEAEKKKVLIKPKPFDKSLVDLQPWALDKLGVYPHKARDGEVPFRLLNKAKVDYLIIVAKTLEEYQKDKKYQYSKVQIQSIFEYYCTMFKVQPLQITDFIIPSENNRTKFSVRNIQISENLNKALACTVPFIHGIYEVEYVNNQINDIMSPLLIISAFVNPSVRRYSYCANGGRNTFKKTFHELVKAWDMKFIEVNLTRSIQQLEILEQLTKSFSFNLFKLNISGCSLSINACRILNTFLLKQQYIKDLNMARCRLSNQSARYILDSLNRNVTIRHLNLSHNDLGSSIYEFGIKISSMLTRQPTLLHCDVSQCGFKREESMFIILAMSTSKNILSLHMTGNELPYYERVFMRSLIAARVQFSTKNQTQRNEIKMNKERYQVMQLAKQEHYLPEIKDYLQTFDKLDEQRQGLDFEIEDLLKEVDSEKYFANVEGVTKLEDLPPDSKLAQLIQKMMERNSDLTSQQNQVKEMMKLTGPQLREKLQQLQNSDVLNLSGKKLENDSGSLENAYAAKNELKKERQRQRAEMDAAKGKKDRSAGEMALLFMGINQVAFDLLIENPMTGYMNEIIYTRILGNDDIEQGNYWADATICYICSKWEKQVISFDPRLDDTKWSQRITQVDHLQDTIDNLYSQAKEVQVIQKAEREAEQLQVLEFEKKRRIALGEESDDGPDFQAQETIFEVEDSLVIDNNVDKVMALGSTTELRINLRPAMNRTAPRLITVGPDILSPKFGGLQGLTPGGGNLRTANIGTEITPRQKVQSSIDNGIYSDALDKALTGKEPKLERIDTPQDKIIRPNKKVFNAEDPLKPRNISLKIVQGHVFPDQFINADDFQELHLRHSPPGTPEEGDSRGAIGQANHDKYMAAKQTTRYGGPPGGMPGLTNKLNAKKHQLLHDQPSLKDIAHYVLNQKEPSHSRPVSHHSQAPSMVTNIQAVGDRQRGQPQKIKRTLFFQGMVYVIEEEVYSDSDNSSVYTSEDDFDTEENMSQHYIAQTGDYQARLADENEARRLALQNPLKTARTLRHEKLGLVEDYQRELSKAQKEYKTKIWPKHYIPHQKVEKSTQLDKVGTKLNLKTGGQKEGRRHNADAEPLIQSGPELKRPIIYLVGSFNDWMPVMLKTKRELTMEKINPDEPIPKSTFVLDNLIHLHANYMAPGKHYFYFVKEEGTIILSPKYEIVRFKATNVFLNQVTVKPRVFDFDIVNVVRGGDDEEQVFLKDKSVFKDFKDDTKVYLRKCFDQDIAYTKIQRTIKGEEDGALDDITELLFKHYIKINNIFLYYIGLSTYPTIGMNDFTSWANKCELVDGKWINLAALDRILITTNVALHGLISSAERDLNRYEFLEILVRIAIAKYRESKVCGSAPLAILELLNKNIFPNSQEVNGDSFRRVHCYNVKVNEILQKNVTVLKKIYDSYTHAKKKYIRLDECRDYVLKTELKVSQMQCGVFFSESMVTLVDTIIDQERPNQMKFVEFLVFLCRCALGHYQDTPYANELMYLKLEKLIPQMLAPLNIQPLFLFYEDFEYIPVQKKYKKVSKKKEMTINEGSQKTDEDEDEESEDLTSEDDLQEFVQLEEGKYKLSSNYVAKMAREKEEKDKRREERAETRAKKQLEKQGALEARTMKREEMDLMSDGGVYEE